MLKNLVRLEHVVADKVFHLVCDPDSPLPSIKDALVKFMAYISQIEEQVKAQQELAAQEKKAAEEPSKPEEIKAE